MIDTHCHLTFEQLQSDVSGVLDRAAAAGVDRVITVCTSGDDAEAGLTLAETYSNVWCTSGVHPLYCDRAPGGAVDWSIIRRVAEHPRCCAWGELGLDRHYDRPPYDLQQRVLEEQLAMIVATQQETGLDKPIVVHCRKAVADLIPVFKSSGLRPERFVFHCFSERPEDARRVLNFGAWISFTGIVTFRNAGEVAESARLVPLDRLMAETDSPFLSPEPVRKQWPNEPANVVHVARRLAELHGVPAEEMNEILTGNAERFFALT